MLLRKETLKSNSKKRQVSRFERERSGDKREGERTRHQSRRREGHRKQTKLFAEVEEGRKKERKEGRKSSRISLESHGYGNYEDAALRRALPFTRQQNSRHSTELDQSSNKGRREVDGSEWNLGSRLGEGATDE